MNIKHMLGALALLGSVGSAHALPFTLNLEGIAPYPSADIVTIGGFYNGGTSSAGTAGVNHGVDFAGDFFTTCLNSTSVFCSGTSKGGMGVPGSGQTAMYVGFGGGWLNVAAGFDTAFSFAFTQPIAWTDTVVNVYSGLDGGGELLASLVLPVTFDPDLSCEAYQATSCPFQNAAIAFAGIARSVEFAGFSGQAVYDDLTFGSAVVGAGGSEPAPNPVPEPATLSLLGAGVLGMLARRRRARH